jgi:putative toxin-antitoxin system antitoxin component (TIGR02293 family)
MTLHQLIRKIKENSLSVVSEDDIESVITSFTKLVAQQNITIENAGTFAYFPYQTEDTVPVNTVEESIMHYKPVIQKNTRFMHQIPKEKYDILDLVHATSTSKNLFNKLVRVSGLSIKYLANEIFEVTPKTFSRYKNEPRKIPALLSEQAIKIIELYDLGNELFGSNKEFNTWLSEKHSLMSNKRPIAYLNTSTGIDMLFEELKRIEFGATA